MSSRGQWDVQKGVHLDNIILGVYFRKKYCTDNSKNSYKDFF